MQLKERGKEQVCRESAVCVVSCSFGWRSFFYRGASSLLARGFPLAARPGMCGRAQTLAEMDRPVPAAPRQQCHRLTAKRCNAGRNKTNQDMSHHREMVLRREARLPHAVSAQAVFLTSLNVRGPCTRRKLF
jgi:hypothetical protein